MRHDPEDFLEPYLDIADIHPEHGVFLVQEKSTGKIFIKKILSVYNTAIYQYIKDNPIPSVPRIYCFQEFDGLLYVIEEYISGDTLLEMMEKTADLSDSDILFLAVQICELVEALHRCTPPIIHRDIKPSNLILTPDHRLRLIDLNAARQVSENKSQDTRLLGSVGYAAPEQFGFGSSDVQADIYSIGILLNQLVTGTVSRTIPADSFFAPIITRCIEVNPADRYQSVQELQAALINKFPENTPDKMQFTAKASPTESFLTENSANNSLTETSLPKGTLSETSLAETKAEEKNSHKTFAQKMKAYLPPGFRSGSVLHMLISVIGYVFLSGSCLVGQFPHFVTNEPLTGVPLTIHRISIALAWLLVIFFSCNYLDLQKHSVLTRMKNPFLRFIGILIEDVLIFLLCFLFTIVIEAFFYR